MSLSINNKVEIYDDYNKSLSSYDKVLDNYPTNDLVLDYLDYCANLYEDELIDDKKYRECYEKAITITGLDIYTGIYIWKKYIEFEIDELEDVIEATGSIIKSSELISSKKRVISLYHRLFSLPLIGIEKELLELNKLLDNIYDDDDLTYINPEKLQNNVKQSINDREGRLIYEDYILSDEFTSLDINEKYKSWDSYIKFEIKDNKYNRVQRLFERAIVDLCNQTTIWSDYITFSIFKLKNYSFSYKIINRYINISNQLSIYMYLYYFIITEKLIDNLTDEDTLLSIITTSLTMIYDSSYSYIVIWIYKLSFYYRKIITLLNHEIINESDIQLNLIKLRTNYLQINEFFNYYYNTWENGYIIIYNYIAKLEDVLVIKILEKLPTFTIGNQLENYVSVDEAKTSPQCLLNPITNQLYESLIKKFPSTYKIHDNYIHCWLHHVKVDHLQSNNIKKLFYRFLDNCTDMFDEIVVDLIGTDFMISDYHDILVTIRYVSSKQSTKVSKQSSQTSNELPVNKKRKSDELIDNENNKKVKFEEVDEPINHTTDEKPTNLSKSKYKIQIKNLSFNTSIDTIKSYLSTCGQIIDSYLVLSKKGSSRGIAKVTFENESDMNKALQLSSTTIDGRPVVIEMDASRDLSNNNSISASTLTIFISKFSKSLTNQSLRELLVSSGLDGIQIVKISYDKKLGESKSTALVQFDNEDTYKRSLSFHKKVIDSEGNLLSILPSKYSISYHPNVKSERIVDDNVVNTNSNKNESVASDTGKTTTDSSNKSETNPYLSDEVGINKQLEKKKININSEKKVTFFKPRGLG